jgi:hypothetical protein
MRLSGSRASQSYADPGEEELEGWRHQVDVLKNTDLHDYLCVPVST